MKLDELEACEESLQELHKSKVLHGDLNPGNFIIVHEQTSNQYLTTCPFFSTSILDYYVLSLRMQSVHN